MKSVRPEAEMTIEELKRLETEGPPPTERPDKLPLNDIHVAPVVFQWRFKNSSLAEEMAIMKDLAQHIKGDDEPRALEPIIVTAIGPKFFVIDGHHRLDAYQKAGWKGPVPVKHFKGTLKEAQACAMKVNAKNKVPMTQPEKSEAAWRMLVDGERDPAWSRSRKEIREATTVSLRHLKRMAASLRELGSEAFKMTWAEVCKAKWAKELEAMGEEGLEGWKEEKARKLADHLLKGPNLLKDPEVTARALRMVSIHLPGLLTDQWPQEARETVLVAVREQRPDKAGAVEDALEDLYGWNSL